MEFYSRIPDIIDLASCSAWRGIALGILCLLTSPAQSSPEDGSTPAPTIESNSLTLQEINQTSYDDNVFRLPSPALNVSELVGPGASYQDHIETLSAALAAQGVTSRQSGTLDIQATKNWFLRNTKLNNTSLHGDATWLWTFGPLFTGQLGAVLNRSLADFAYTGVYVKDIVRSTEYFDSMRLTLSPSWVLFGGASLGRTDQSAPALQLDNFHRTSSDIGSQYFLDPNDTIGGQYTFTSAKFSDAVLLNGLPFNRNYHESVEKLLFKHQSSRLLADISGGYLERSYPQATVGAFSGPVWKATFSWEATSHAQLAISAWRELRAFVEAESNYFVADGLSFAPTWTPRPKLQLSAKISTERQNFIPSDIGVPFSRHDRLTTGQAVVGYSPRDEILLQFTYERNRRTSSYYLYGFDDGLYLLTVAFKN